MSEREMQSDEERKAAESEDVEGHSAADEQLEEGDVEGHSFTEDQIDEGSATAE